MPGHPPAPERARHIDRQVSLRLDGFWFIEAARDKQRTPHFNPSRFRQTAQSRADSIPLRECHVIEIQRAHCWHTVVAGQDYLRRQSSNSSRSRYDNDFVQAVDEFISREDENGPALIGIPKRVSADLAPPQPISSQPSGSQASGSSPAENSSCEGGTDR
jgi:hypothetical protein